MVCFYLMYVLLHACKICSKLLFYLYFTNTNSIGLCILRSFIQLEISNRTKTKEFKMKLRYKGGKPHREIYCHISGKKFSCTSYLNLGTCVHGVMLTMTTRV